MQRCFLCLYWDGKQHFLVIPVRPDGRQHGDVAGFTIHPHLDRHAVQDPSLDLFTRQAACTPRLPFRRYLALGSTEHILLLMAILNSA